MLSPRRWRAVTLVAAACAVSTAAFGLPWDVDMADSAAIKAYEREMAPLPEGVVAQDSDLSPTVSDAGVGAVDRMSPEAGALVNPLDASDAEVLATGERMYGIYCTPCHGADGVALGPVAQPGRFPAVPLAGPGGALKLRSDGYVFLTARDGGAILPYYGWAMDDHELWSVVAYTRTLADSAYVPPAPAEDTDTSEAEEAPQ